MKLKKCSTCKKEYPANYKYFYKDRSRVDGFNLSCKDCVKAYQKRYLKRKQKEKYEMYGVI